MKQLLETLQKKIKFAHRLATAQNFSELLSEGSTLIHFSGHGYDKSKYNTEEDVYLAFEHQEVKLNRILEGKFLYYVIRNLKFSDPPPSGILE